MPALGCEYSDYSDPESQYQNVNGKLACIRLSDFNCRGSARQAPFQRRYTRLLPLQDHQIFLTSNLFHLCCIHHCRPSYTGVVFSFIKPQTTKLISNTFDCKTIESNTRCTNDPIEYWRQDTDEIQYLMSYNLNTGLILNRYIENDIRFPISGQCCSNETMYIVRYCNMVRNLKRMMNIQYKQGCLCWWILHRMLAL